MGRHRREERRPYERVGTGLFEREILALLSTWHHRVGEPVERWFSRTADKLWALRRSQRWIICLSLGVVVLLAAAAIAAALIQGDKRDHRITMTQGSEQGVLLEEDYAGCGMRIDLHGRTISAHTSCATTASYPAGTRIDIVEDPEAPGRFLVVGPGQDWTPLPDETIFVSGLVGLLVATGAVAGAHRLLLSSSISEAPREPQNPTSERPQGTGSPYEPLGVAFDRFGDSWEAKKAAASQAWVRFVEGDVRIRGSLLAALVIAVSGAAFVFGSASHADREQDRQLALTQPVIITQLLETSSEGSSTMVRLGTEAVPLAYKLRREFFLDIGQDVPVVEDPQRPGWLIPAEIADARGIFGFLSDNAPLLIGWLAAVGFLAWMLIPKELVAAGDSLDKILRRGKPRGRH